MIKNVLIGLLILIVFGETAYIVVKKVESHVATIAIMQVKPSGMPSVGPGSRGGRQMIIGKGSNLKTTPLFQYAFEIAPTATSDAKKVMTGFSMISQTQADGSIVVTLTPKDSDDQNQQYIVKPGQVLYYIEQTPVDDKNDQDKDLNYRDDYGIITDANGIVQ